MATADKTVRDLMEDAILVATYGQRSGRFKDNTLFVAVQKASAVPALDWSSPELIELQAALNAAVQAIEPVNLVDLRSGWTPFPAGNDPGRARALGKFGFVAAAVLLIFFCGYYTVLHKRAGLVLADMASAREEQQATILNEVFFRLVGLNEDGAGGDLGNPSSLSHVAIREKLQELRAIERKMIENKRDYNEIVVSLVPGQTLYYRALGMLNPPPSYAAEKAGVFAQGGQQAAGAGTLMANCASSGLASAATEAAPADGVSPEAKAMTWFIGLVRQQDQLLRQIRCIVGLRGGDRFELADFNASEFYYVNDPANLSQTTEVLGLWVLPGLYGALGAMMYYMRTFLNPLLRDPNFIRVLLRVSLGSFAGIAVAWFWSPAFTQSVGVADITLGVLTMAFLLGFGIDVFFALLDRLVTMITAAIGRLGAPA